MEIKGGTIAERDIICEKNNHEGSTDLGEARILYLAIRESVLFSEHPFRNSQYPVPMQTDEAKDHPWMGLRYYKPKDDDQ